MSQQTSSTKRERRDAARAERLERERAAVAAAQRKRRLTMLAGALAAAAVIVVVAVLVSSGGGGGKKTAAGGGAVVGAAATQQLLAGIPQQGLTLGNAGAPVTIVEFVDPQCPYCRDYSVNELPTVIQQQVRTGKAKLELRMLHFIGPDSTTAARALTAAGMQNKLFNAAEVLYHNQGEENSGYVTDAYLRRILGAVPGLDVNRAMQDASSTTVTEELGTAQTAQSRYGVGGTPTILVGPTGGTLKADGEQTPTAVGIAKLVDAAAAQKA